MTWICSNDTYCPTPDTFETVAAFLAMCQACFGEQPTLTFQQDVDRWVDGEGRTVLVEDQTITFLDFDPRIIGIVEITLSTMKPKYIVETGGPTEEGYLYTSVEWALEGQFLLKITTTDSKDCDGRYDSFLMEASPLQPKPDWKRIASRQQDHSAEAAGY